MLKQYVLLTFTEVLLEAQSTVDSGRCPRLLSCFRKWRRLTRMGIECDTRYNEFVRFCSRVRHCLTLGYILSEFESLVACKCVSWSNALHILGTAHGGTMHSRFTLNYW